MPDPTPSTLPSSLAEPSLASFPDVASRPGEPQRGILWDGSTWSVVQLPVHLPREAGPFTDLEAATDAFMRAGRSA